MTGAIQDLGADDLELIQNVLHYYPGVGEILTLAKQIDSAGYPLNSLEELFTRVSEMNVQFAGRAYDTAALRRFTPAYYFPIASRNDLIAKLVELHRISRNISTRQSAVGPGQRPAQA